MFHFGIGTWYNVYIHFGLDALFSQSEVNNAEELNDEM